jgi:hypothetical protein
MAERHPLFTGVPRLDEAFASPSRTIRPAPPKDDPAAIRRIQRALAMLVGEGFMNKSFPNGFDQEPDGQYGQQTMEAVIRFQKQAFPNKPSEWDGRCGPKTLQAMNDALPGRLAPVPPVPPPVIEKTQDVVVILQGGAEKGRQFEPGKTPEIQTFVAGEKPEDFKKAVQTPDYLETHHELIIAVNNGDGSTNGAPGFAQGVADFIIKNAGANGRAILIGWSSGGANVIEVASKLQGKVPIRYIGISDAAFSSASDPRIDLSFQAIQSENFFQSLGNPISLAGQEIHAAVKSCQRNRDFAPDAEFQAAEKERKGSLLQNRANQKAIEKFHEMAVRKGNRIVFPTARGILAR